MSETNDKETRALQEQLNIMTYVADTREKFLAEAISTASKILTKIP